MSIQDNLGLEGQKQYFYWLCTGSAKVNSKSKQTQNLYWAQSTWITRSCINSAPEIHASSCAALWLHTSRFLTPPLWGKGYSRFSLGITICIFLRKRAQAKRWLLSTLLPFLKEIFLSILRRFSLLGSSLFTYKGGLTVVASQCSHAFGRSSFHGSEEKWSNHVLVSQFKVYQFVLLAC